MTFLYSLFFGAGVGAFAYAKLARRTGYGNTRDAWIVSGIIFILATIFFFMTFSLFSS